MIESVISGILVGLITSLISGAILMSMKTSVQKGQRLSDENTELRFQGIHNKIGELKNEQVGTKNEVMIVKGQLYKMRDDIHALDKKTEVIIAEQKHYAERLSIAQNHGKVIRRE